jgi:hypothetical protein
MIVYTPICCTLSRLISYSTLLYPLRFDAFRNQFRGRVVNREKVKGGGGSPGCLCSSQLLGNLLYIPPSTRPPHHNMSGKYVPPSRREGYTPKATDTPPWVRLPKPQFRSSIKQDFQLLEQIFQTPQQGTYNYYLYPNPPQPILAYDPTRTPENTPLPPSAPSHPLGNLICYIMIFPRAHPLWEEGGELWHHTASETLAGDWKGEKRNFARPIPVFGTSSTGMKGKVHCLGWWWVLALLSIEPEY